MRTVILTVLVACGRLGFDIHGTGDAHGDGHATPDTIISTGLLAYYPFDDPSAINTYVDATGHGHDAYNPDYFSCPTIIAAHVNDGASFNAMGALLYVDATPDLITTTGFTVAAWLRIAAAPGAQYMCALNKPLAMAGADAWQLCITQSLQIYFGFGGATGDIFSPNNAFTVGVWHYAAITWDGQRTAIWLDGAMQNSTAAPVGMFDTSSILIGYDFDPALGDVAGFDGVIDEVRIYDHALSATELAQLAGT